MPPVVIQVGSRIFKFGLAGESMPMTTQETSEFSHKRHIDVLPNEYSSEENRAISNLEYLFHPNILDFRPGNDLHSFEYTMNLHIFDILHYMFKKNRINAVNANVVLVANSMLNKKYRDILRYQLLEKLHAKSTVFLEEPLMATLAAGTRSALVVDLDWHFVLIEPVYDLRVLRNHFKWSKRGAKWLSLNNADVDLLFDTNDDIYENDEKTPLQLLVELYHELPIDLRKPLYETIIFAGELAKNQQLIQTILQGLKAENIHASSVVSLGAWAGASIYTDTVLSKDGNWNSMGRIKRENYITH
ncbi:hypothetical protein KL905_000304 [Ogataea polymorpha]|nr:hypothetical protein KL906_000882 [Ogataea polymorpha]KAG7912605.1 hypothetical protein KL907_000807 [Ogataea polymorpha]KAG7919219.1 hypothetical protein KL927_001348 [Ogataea polymorpha]KAG7924150.1 hypothetical protein KL905_000304 [Ogataea polymorpha]KAG7937223.1 hypothetical protein KL934_001426 [Ogataea polymorpha]